MKHVTSDTEQITVGHGFSDGSVVKEIETIKDGILELTFFDGSSAIWLSPQRLSEYPPDDIEFTDEGIVQIEELDSVLEWYDIEWESYGLHDGKWRGDYHYKTLKRHQFAEQCFVHVKLPCGTKKKWAAVVSSNGDIESITTDDGKELKTLAELRATGIIEANLVSEYSIINF